MSNYRGTNKDAFDPARIFLKKATRFLIKRSFGAFGRHCISGGCESYGNLELIYHRDGQTASIKSGHFAGKIKQAQVKTELGWRIIDQGERGARLAEGIMWKWTYKGRNYPQWARKVGKSSWITNFGPLAKRNCYGRKIRKSWGESQRRASEIVADIRRIRSIQGH